MKDFVTVLYQICSIIGIVNYVYLKWIAHGMLFIVCNVDAVISWETATFWNTKKEVVIRH